MYSFIQACMPAWICVNTHKRLYMHAYLRSIRMFVYGGTHAMMNCNVVCCICYVRTYACTYVHTSVMKCSAAMQHIVVCSTCYDMILR